MKKINILILTFAALCLFWACNNDYIGSLKGDYDCDRYNFDVLTIGDITDMGDYKIMDVTIHDSNDGNTMAITFGASSSLLPATSYTLVNEIDGARQYKATINGSSVVDGTLDVQTVGDIYYFSSMMTDARGTLFVMNYKGVPGFEGEPAPIELTTILSTADNTTYGGNTITLKVGTDGVGYYYDWNLWADVYTGTGNFLAVDFYSEDGKLQPGTYTPADSESVGPGNFVMGYDTEMWGYMYYDWGTCWWTVDNGTTSAAKILDGTIVVKKSGTTFTITLNATADGEEIYAEYSGPIAEFDSGDAGDAVELTNVLVYTDNSAYSSQITLKFGTEGVGYYYDSDTWSDVYTGTGHYFATDIYSPDGKLYAGTYTPADSESCGEGNFVMGYDTEFWGFMYYNWGTCWFSVDNGATEGEKITDGTITVAIDGDTFTVTVNSSVVAAVYTGPIDDANPNL